MVEAYYACLRCKNRKVRVATIDGRQYEGIIVDVDRNNVYLKTEGNREVTSSAFYPYAYNNDILTLSLFVLLTIALL